MSGDVHGLIELGLTLAAVFGFGLWQLRSVTRSIADDRSTAENKSRSDAARHAVGEHPLDGG